MDFRMNGTAGVIYANLGTTITVSLGGDLVDDILRVDYAVFGTDETVTSGMISTINTSLANNYNSVTFESTFVNPSDALSPMGRGIGLVCNVYTLNGSLIRMTGIVFTKVAANQTILPLVAGQSTEADSEFGWIPQANAAIRYGGDPLLGISIPINSSPVASDHTGQPTGTCSLFWDASAGKLKLAINGTSQLYTITPVSSSWP